MHTWKLCSAMLTVLTVRCPRHILLHGQQGLGIAVQGQGPRQKRG
jgi:hypothetical protein